MLIAIFRSHPGDAASDSWVSIKVKTITPLVRASSLSGFNELVRRHGGTPEHLLAQLSLPANFLDEPDRLILLKTKIELLELAARHCHCPGFGLQLGRQQHISILGPLGILVQQCETIGDALQMIARYIHHHILAMDIVHEEKEGIVYCGAVYTDLRASGSRQLNDLTLASGYKFLSMLCVDPPKLRSVFLSGPAPRDPEPYTQLFGAPVAFERPFNAMVFDALFLDHRVPGASPPMRRIVRGYFDQHHPDDLPGRTRSVIRSMLPYKKVNLVGVAGCLGMAPRTLQHQLAQQGQAFQPLVDEIRIQRACAYLAESHLSLTDITSLVGYTQQSALSRCFKRLKGVSPAQWRKQHRTTRFNSPVGPQ